MAIIFLSTLLQIIIFSRLTLGDSNKFALHPHFCVPEVLKTFHNFKCLNVVVDKHFTSHNDTFDRTECIFRHFPYIPRKLWSFETILSQNITRQRRPNVMYCEDFLIMTPNVSQTILAVFASGQKRFRPFSRIIFVFDHSGGMNDAHFSDVRIDTAERDYIQQSAIYGYFLDFGLNGFRGGFNILTNQYWPSTSIRGDWFTNDDPSYPAIVHENTNKVFRIGLYNCPPYIVYDDGRR